MTIDEKLSHFYDITVEDARAKAAAILEEHRQTLEKMTEERKALSEENAQAQIKAETANARREVNKALSAEQLTIKRDWTKKQNDLKEKIFSEVKELLKSFTKLRNMKIISVKRSKRLWTSPKTMKSPSIFPRKTAHFQRSFNSAQAHPSSSPKTLSLAVSAPRFLTRTS